MSANIDEDRVLEALEEALEARLIEALPRGLERYQLSHALIQQALSEELSPSRRLRLHARIGDALEELYGPDTETHASELAYHFAQAEAVTGHGIGRGRIDLRGFRHRLVSGAGGAPFWCLKIRGPLGRISVVSLI